MHLVDKKQSNGTLGWIAGVITAGILQPLENIKIAMMIPPKDLFLGNNIFYNMILTKKYISKYQGVYGFSKGIVASSLKSGFGSYLYFQILRYLQKSETLKQNFYRNFLNSLTARVVSTFLSNPLSVIQTRYQMANFHGYVSILDAFKKIIENQGWRTLFKGGLVSCFKQGIFAGFYYMLYQQMKELGYGKLVSGIVSGLISTTASHPLQIIRARLQTQGIRWNQQKVNQSITIQLWKMFKKKQCFKGLVPRLMKKPLANTITFCIFETLEQTSRQKHM